MVVTVCTCVVVASRNKAVGSAPVIWRRVPRSCGDVNAHQSVSRHIGNGKPDVTEAAAFSWDAGAQRPQPGGYG